MSTSETLILQAANVNPLGHNSCHTSIELSKPTSVSDPLPKDGLKEESSTATDSALKKPVSTLNPNARPWKPFWSAELQVLANERDRMYRRWRRAVGLYKVYPYLAYKEARDTFQKAVRSAKRQVWRASQDTVAKTQIEKKMIKLCESVVFIYPGEKRIRIHVWFWVHFWSAMSPYANMPFSSQFTNHAYVQDNLDFVYNHGCPRLRRYRLQGSYLRTFPVKFRIRTATRVSRATFSWRQSCSRFLNNFINGGNTENQPVHILDN